MVCTTLAAPSSTLRSAGRRMATQRQRQADREAEQQRGDADRDMAAEIGRQPRAGFGELRAHGALELRRSRSAWRRGVAISSRT